MAIGALLKVLVRSKGAFVTLNTWSLGIWWLCYCSILEDGVVLIFSLYIDLAYNVL